MYYIFQQHIQYKQGTEKRKRRDRFWSGQAGRVWADGTRRPTLEHASLMSLAEPCGGWVASSLTVGQVHMKAAGAVWTDGWGAVWR